MPLAHSSRALAAAVCACMLSACSSPDRPRVSEPQPKPIPQNAGVLTPVEPRIDVIPGARLVIPVGLAPGRSIRDAAARLDDGRIVSAEFTRLSVSVNPADARWLPPAGEWSATDARDVSARQAADTANPIVWAIAADVPADALGQGLWILGERLMLSWVPLPPGDSGSAYTLAPRQLPESAAEDTRTPLRRWRYTLASGRALIDGPPPGREFQDPALEAFARQTEARWHAALGWLAAADAAVAQRLVRRITTFMDLSLVHPAALAPVPAFPADSEDLEDLRSDLLNLALSPAQRLERARAWLRSQPPALAWVIDDAGLRDGASGAPVAAIAIANLEDRDTLAWVQYDLPDGPQRSEPVRLPAQSAVRIALTNHAAMTVHAHAGSWRSAPLVLRPLTPLTPPGLKIAALTRQWDMQSWLLSLPQPATALTSALLQPAAPASDAQSPGSRGSGWSLVLQCSSDVPASDADAVTILLGPSPRAAAAIRVSSAGVLQRIDAQGAPIGEPEAITIAREPGRWLAVVPLPAAAVEPDGVIRLGLIRTDARGERSSWPRPLMPFTSDPGRAAIDTTAWWGPEQTGLTPQSQGAPR